MRDVARRVARPRDTAGGDPCAARRGVHGCRRRRARGRARAAAGRGGRRARDESVRRDLPPSRRRARWLASLAGVPLLWVAIAWRDVWALLLTPATVWVTTVVLRSLARRRANDDEFVLWRGLGRPAEPGAVASNRRGVAYPRGRRPAARPTRERARRRRCSRRGAPSPSGSACSRSRPVPTPSLGRRPCSRSRRSASRGRRLPSRQVRAVLERDLGTASSGSTVTWWPGSRRCRMSGARRTTERSPHARRADRP